MQNLEARAKNIRLAIFDVDGVLTSGKLFYGPEGIEYKAFHVQDGQGIKYLQQSGVEIGIITACTTAIVAKRMQDLGIIHVYMGAKQKVAAYEELKAKLHLEDEQIAYMGDDIPDLPLISRVGLSMTVPNAPAILQKHAHAVTRAKGGKGAAREMCELIMQAQGTLEPLIQSHLHR